MTTLIKILLFTTTFLFFSVCSKAQFKLPKVLAFGNFTYASPQGSFGTLYKTYNSGNGFEIGGGIGLGKNILYASTGYVSYGSKAAGNYKVIPVKIGLRRYLLLGLFLNGAVGIANQSYSYSSAKNSSFLYEVGAGFKFLHLIEIGAAYSGWNNAIANNAAMNAFLLKAGLALKL